MAHAEEAMEKFTNGFNCAQSVLYSYAQELNFDADAALRIATGFGAGMGRKQEICGAISGAIMAIGLRFGRGEHDGEERREQTYAIVQKLLDAFVEKYGAISCKQLLGGCSLLTEEGRRRFHDEGLRDKCREYVGAVCELLDRIQPAAL